MRVVLPGSAEELADFFADLGALAVERESEAVAASFDDERPAGLEDRVESFLHLIDRAGRAALQTRSGEGPWLDGWRGVFFGADCGRFRIRPPWVAPPADGVPIFIDPRGAFGSGLHPSTQLALILLHRQLDGRGGQAFLDVGAGSGVLSVAAARCGLRACAVESVEAAREACRRTAAVNGVHIELHAAIPAGSFGLVAANMAVTSLLELGPQFRRAVAPGGALIVSGTRSEQLPEVLAALGISAAQGAQLDAGEWSAFLL